MSTCPDRSVGFTEAQRLKGLKKQLRNLGYDVTPTGEASSPPDDPSSEASSDTTAERAKLGVKSLDELAYDTGGY